MKVCVTGSSGFIGHHLVETLAAEGHEVMGVDIKPPRATPSGFEFIICDILDVARLTRALQAFAPDAVAHLAARTDLDETKSLEGYAANIQGTENVVAAVRATPSVRRAIYTSSQLVCRIGYVPLHDEDYAPNTLYGESKIRTEQIVRAADGGNATWCLVRPTTVWGPGMNEHFQRFFRLIYQGLYFHIGRGPVHQPYGYVGNVVYQYQKLLEAPPEEIEGKTFYLTDFERFSLRVWTNLLQEEMGAPLIRTLPQPVARLAASVGDLLAAAGYQHAPLTTFRFRNLTTEYQFETNGLKEICGALPFSVREGVRATVAWLRADGVIPTKPQPSL